MRQHSGKYICQDNLLVAKDDAIIAIAKDGKDPAMPKNTLLPFMMALCADGGSVQTC